VQCVAVCCSVQCVSVCCSVFICEKWIHCVWPFTDMGWLRLAGSLKVQVSIAKEPYKRDLYSAKETYNFKEPNNCSHPINSTRRVQQYDSSKYVWHDSFVCGQSWIVFSVCDVNHSYAVCCSVLQCVAVCCSVLQCVTWLIRIVCSRVWHDSCVCDLLRIICTSHTWSERPSWRVTGVLRQKLTSMSR